MLRKINEQLLKDEYVLKVDMDKLYPIYSKELYPENMISFCNQMNKIPGVQTMVAFDYGYITLLADSDAIVETFADVANRLTMPYKCQSIDPKFLKVPDDSTLFYIILGVGLTTDAKEIDAILSNFITELRDEYIKRFNEDIVYTPIEELLKVSGHL